MSDKFDFRAIPIIDKRAARDICALIDVDSDRVEYGSMDLHLNPNSAPRVTLTFFLSYDEVKKVSVILARNLTK